MTTGLLAQSTYSTQYTFTTLAGTPQQKGTADGAASTALFNAPYAIAVDDSGNVFVTDTFNSSVREISGGMVTTLATDSQGLNGPMGIVSDGSGNLFVTDTYDNTILKITYAGIASVFAGSSAVGPLDGTGTAAQFFDPRGIAMDSSGNVYIADCYNDTIRKVTSAGVVTTIAGTADTAGSADGTGTAAQFNAPMGIAIDSSGNLYVTDSANNTIRKITGAGVVTTLAGKALATGSADGVGTAAAFNGPAGIAVDASGNIFVADFGNDSIRMVTSSGIVSTIAGVTHTFGAADGTGSAALFYGPCGLAIDGSGNLYVTDSNNDTIRMGHVAAAAAPRISSQSAGDSVNAGSITTLSIEATGVPLPAFQWELNGVPVSSTDNRISGQTGPTLTITGTETTDAGTYSVVVSNATGSVTSAPVTLTVTTPVSYSVSAFAGIGVGTWSGPNGLAVGPTATVYAVVGNSVGTLDQNGTYTVLAGNAQAAGSGDGTGAAALFDNPGGIAVDASGNVYVADTGNNSIRKVSPQGVVQTVAGLVEGDIDGTGIGAYFDGPTAVAVDSIGNIFVVDAGNNALREIHPDGSTHMLLSASSFTYLNVIPSADNSYQETTYKIAGVCVDAQGDVYAGVSSLVPPAPAFIGSNYVSVLKVASPGAFIEVSRVAESANVYRGTGDGALTVDASGNVYALAGEELYEGANLISSLVGPNAPSPFYSTVIAAYFPGKILFNNSSERAVDVATAVGAAPTLSSQPAGGVISFGASIDLSAGATGSPAPSFQWYWDGVAVTGATASTYVASAPGSYTVTASNNAGSVTSTAAVITAATRLADISSRGFVGTGSNVEIAGFAVTGPTGSQETVLIRGAGPSLATFGISGFLAQPVITLFDSKGNELATNAGWNTASNAAAIAAAFLSTGAYPFPLDSADSAILISLPPGNYTAVIAGLNGTTGVALAEVYDETKGDPQIINISTRAFVGTNAAVEIGGFVVTGTQSAKVLVRAIGPALSQFGVTGVLTNPTLSVMDSTGAVVATNSGWSTNSNPSAIAAEMASVGAFALPQGSADCVLLLTLPPGNYTAVVSGVDGSSGVALVEVYEAP